MINGNNLAETAANIAIHAAVEWLKVRDMSADPESLITYLHVNSKDRIKKALDDAKEAFDCGMHDVGISTFRAEMVLMGIDAAKYSSKPTKS